MENKRGALNPKQIARFAREKGFEVIDGNGRHSIHLIAPNGSRMPLPFHGARKGLATGTRITLIRFIEKNAA